MMLEWEIYTGKDCSWPIYRYFAVAWFQAKGATNVLLGLSSTVHVQWWDSDVKSTFLTLRSDIRLEWLRNMVTPPLIPVSLLQSNYSCYLTFSNHIWFFFFNIHICVNNALIAFCKQALILLNSNVYTCGTIRKLNANCSFIRLIVHLLLQLKALPLLLCLFLSFHLLSFCLCH